MWGFLLAACAPEPQWTIEGTDTAGPEPVRLDDCVSIGAPEVIGGDGDQRLVGMVAGPEGGRTLLMHDAGGIELADLADAPATVSEPRYVTWSQAATGETVGLRTEPAPRASRVFYQWLAGTDAQGGTLFTGSYEADLRLDEGLDSERLITAAGVPSAVVLRRDEAGSIDWLRTFTSEKQGMWVMAAAKDDGGAVVGIGRAPLEETVPELVRLSPDGERRWTQEVRGVDDATVAGVVSLGPVDSPINLLLTSVSASGEVVFGAGKRSETRIDPPGRADVVVQYDAQGEVRWVTGFSGGTRVRFLSALPDGGVAVLGLVGSPGILGFGTREEVPVSPAGAEVFLARLDGEGRVASVFVSQDREGATPNEPVFVTGLSDGSLVWGLRASRTVFVSGPTGTYTVEAPPSSFGSVVWVDGNDEVRCILPFFETTYGRSAAFPVVTEGPPGAVSLATDLDGALQLGVDSPTQVGPTREYDTVAIPISVEW